MMSLRHLKYFVAISEEKSFISAAKKLNTVQSSLSQQIKDLEDFLGCELFERGARTLKLTAAGNVFLENAKKTLDESEKLLNIARNLNQKNIYILKVGVLIGAESKLPLYILDLIQNENSSLKVEIISDNGPALIDMLERGEIEVAFTRSNLNTSEIVSLLYSEDRLVFVTSKKDGELLDKNIYFENNQNINFIIPSREYAYELHDKIINLLKENFSNYKIVMETENAFTTMSYVSMGIGCTILPEYVSQIMTENLSIREFNKIKPEIELYLNLRKSLKKVAFEALKNSVQH